MNLIWLVIPHESSLASLLWVMHYMILYISCSNFHAAFEKWNSLVRKKNKHKLHAGLLFSVAELKIFFFIISVVVQIMKRKVKESIHLKTALESRSLCLITSIAIKITQFMLNLIWNDFSFLLTRSSKTDNIHSRHHVLFLKIKKLENYRETEWLSL